MTMQRNFVNRIIDICKENKDKTFITYMKEDDTCLLYTSKDQFAYYLNLDPANGHSLQTHTVECAVFPYD